MPQIEIATRAPMQRLIQVAASRTGQAPTFAAALLASGRNPTEGTLTLGRSAQISAIRRGLVRLILTTRWNAESCRDFDLTDLWTIGAIARDKRARSAVSASFRDFSSHLRSRATVRAASRPMAAGANRDKQCRT
jgi:hypothetical protein